MRQAVAIGLALDTLYSARSGLAPATLAERVFRVLTGLKLATYHPALDWRMSPAGGACWKASMNSANTSAAN